MGSIIIPTFQIQRLRHREGENMPRFPELAMMELGFKSSQSGTKSPQAYPLFNCTLDLRNFLWPLSPQFMAANISKV